MECIAKMKINGCDTSIVMKEVESVDSVISAIENVKEILDEVIPSEPSVEPPTPPSLVHDVLLTNPVPPEYAASITYNTQYKRYDIAGAFAEGKTFGFKDQASVGGISVQSGSNYTGTVFDFTGMDVGTSEYSLGQHTKVVGLHITRTGVSKELFLNGGSFDHCKFDIAFTAGLKSIITTLNGVITNSELKAGPYSTNKCIGTITANGSIGENNIFDCPERS